MKGKTAKNLALISDLMIKHQLTLAVAESCTAGMIQNFISNSREAMSFFQGGITVYNSGQKAKQLNVNPILAEQCNSVSKKIAEKLASEVAIKFNAELGISITGFTQPIPEKGIHHCFAYISLAYPSKVLLSKRITAADDADMYENQILYSETVLDELVKILKDYGTDESEG